MQMHDEVIRNGAEAACKAGVRTIGVLWRFLRGNPAEGRCIAIYKGPSRLLARYDQSPLVRDAAAG